MAEAKKPKKKELPTPLYNLQGPKLDRLKAIYNGWQGCKRCQLCNFRLTSEGKPFDEICFGEGNPDGHIMFIGEAPGAEEEKTGTPFVGESGMMLNQILSIVSDSPEIQELYKWYSRAPRGDSVKGAQNRHVFHEQMNIWRHQQFFFTNAVCCRPPENRTPVREEVHACWERLWNVIYIVDPMLIVAVGKTALMALVKKQMEITKFRGQIIDCTFQGNVGPLMYPILPILHPSFLLRKADWKVAGGDFEKTVKDVYKAMQVLDELRLRHYGTPIPVRYGNM